MITMMMTYNSDLGGRLDTPAVDESKETDATGCQHSHTDHNNDDDDVDHFVDDDDFDGDLMMMVKTMMMLRMMTMMTLMRMISTSRQEDHTLETAT